MLRRILSIETLVLIYVVVVGLMFTFFVPPFQKPDEIVHFYSALAVNPFGMNEKRFFNMPEKFKVNQIAFHNDMKFSSNELLYKDTDKSAVDLSIYKSRYVGFMSYLPSELGIMIGNQFDSPIIAFWLARFFGLILFLTAIILSLVILRGEYQGVILIFAIMPMVLHQVTSVSYDAMPLIMMPLIFSFFIRLMTNRGRLGDTIGLLISLTLFLIAKGGYYLFGLVVLMVLIKKYDGFFKKIWWMAVFPIGLIAFKGLAIFYYLITQVWGPGSGIVNPKMQDILLSQDPGYFWQVLANTMTEKWDFYYQTFIGYFGWLDYQYNLYVVIIMTCFILFFILEILKTRVKPIISKGNLLILWLLVVGMVIILEAWFYITWTNVGAKTIEGLTGRYVLVLLPFAILALTETILTIGKRWAKLILVGLVMVVIANNTYKVIYARYYDFSERFKNDRELAKNTENAKKEGQIIEWEKLNKKVSFVVGVSPEDNIGGFNLYFTSRDIISRVPYRYVIKDSECLKTKIVGYLDQSKLKDEGVLTTKFTNFQPGDNALCVILLPVYSGPEETYIKIGKLDEQYLFNFLFQTTEEKYK